MTENLTLVEGIDYNTIQKLNKAGIRTIEQLANARVEDLLLIEGLDVKFSERLISEAIKVLNEEEEPKLPKNGKLTSKYSMKTTTKRDKEENL